MRKSTLAKPSAQQRRAASSDGVRSGNARNLERQLTKSAFVFSAAIRELFEARAAAEAAIAGLTASHLKLLYLIWRAGRITVGDAAGFLGISSAAASKTVDKLVRDGLLRRARAPRDRRSSLLSATAEGCRLAGAHLEARRREADFFLDEFSARELRMASRLLDRFASAIVGCRAKPEKVCMRCGTCSRENCRFRALGHRTCIYHTGADDKKGAFRHGAA